MSKKLMSLLMAATLACGLTYACDEIEAQKKPEQTEEAAALASCGQCPHQQKPQAEETTEEQETTLAICGSCGNADCGCKKKKHMTLADSNAKVKVDGEETEEDANETTLV